MMSYRFLHVKTYILMSLRFALLGAIADRPRTGYELLKHFEQSLAYAWPASHSQIYPELARLREDGLIEQTGSGPRNSKTYAVTESGLEEVRHWLRDTEPDRRIRNDAALRTFFLWLLEPEEAVRHVESERAYARGLLDELVEIRDRPRGPGRKEQAFGIALEGGIRSLETRLEWLDWAEVELRRSAGA
jgi:PadR family transcriptional regulator, regulatory protein AphA